VIVPDPLFGRSHCKTEEFDVVDVTLKFVGALRSELVGDVGDGVGVDEGKAVIFSK